MTFSQFGLKPNRYYESQNIRVKHKDGNWYTLIRTSNKMLFLENGNQEKRMKLTTLVDVSFDTQRIEKQEKQEMKKQIDNEDYTEWAEAILDVVYTPYNSGTESNYFDNDFAMASNVDYLFDNDSMFC